MSIIKKNSRALAVLIVIQYLLIPTTLADEASLNARITQLEKQLNIQFNNPAALSQPFNVSTLVELEAFVQDSQAANSSDASLATLEVAIQSRLNPWLEAQVLFLHEADSEQDLIVDQGFIVLSSPGSAVSLVAGKQVIAFGHFESHFISDPLTLELAETKNTALTLHASINASLHTAQLHLYASAYAFNGDIQEQGKNDEIKQLGAQLGLGGTGNNLHFNVGMSFISSLAESATLLDFLQTNNSHAQLQQQTAAASIHALLSVNHCHLLGEYVSATESFDERDLSFAGTGAQPASYNLELAADFTLLGKPVTLAVAQQGSRQALALEIPKQRTMLVASYPLYKQTEFAIEYAQAKDYAEKDGGSHQLAHTVSIQLAAEF